MQTAGIALLAIVGVWASPTAALDPTTPIYRHVQDVWNVEDGLPQSSVNALAQTRDGYLWVGTYDGLARFDGYRFEVFRAASLPGLGSSSIRSLHVDRQGRLWIGTGGGGVSVRDPGGAIRLVEDTEGWLVRAVAQGPDDAIWVGSTDRGLVRLGDDGRPTGVAIAPGVTSVNAVLADADGTLWAGTNGTGLWRRSPAGDWQRIDTAGAELILALYRDRLGELWVGTAGSGLLRLSADGAVKIPEEALGARTVATVAEDRAGALWLGTAGGGLVRRWGDTFERHARHTGLPHDVLSALLEDAEGSLWVGLSAAGLIRLQGGSFTSYGPPDGLAGDVAYSIVEDRGGDLWVASVGGSLYRGRAGRFDGAPIPGLPERTQLRSLALDPAGDLWLATYGAGVARRSAAGWRVFTEADGLANDHVRALAVDAAGAVWAATIRGLSRFADGAWTTYTERDGLPSSSLVAVAGGPDGSVWFGMDGGGLGGRTPDGVFRFYTRADGLANNVVLALRAGADGRSLWIGTNGGLSRLRDGQLTSWTTRDGLPSDNVAQIAEGADGHLWVGTAAGVARIRLATLTAEGARLDLRIFGRGDGIAISQVSAPSNGPLVARNGHLWFPTLGGLATVNPSRLTHDDLAPIVHVEGIVADGRPLAPSATVHLPQGTARLEIQYTGICTRAAQLVRFRHRLHGFENDWQEAGSRRTAYYTAVPPGNYRFEVAASNADGAAATTGLALILPHRIWQTSLFRYGLALTLLGLAGGSVVVRTRGLKRRSQVLAATVAERTEELHRANQELADTNRRLAELSLRDPLTGLANRRRFDEVFDEEWRRATRQGGWLSLALVDVDCFKQFNDARGHAAGDVCLRRVAETLQATAHRAGELSARWGGEEFALLLPGSSPDDSARLGELLRHRVEALAEPHPASTVGPVLTVSVGTASLRPTAASDPLALFRAADAALYRAKGNGRNRVEQEVIPSGPSPASTENSAPC